MTNSQLNLVETKNNQVLTNSLKVAKKFEKQHSKLCNKIKEILGIVKFGDTQSIKTQI